MNVDRRYCRIVIDTCKDYNKYRDDCFRFTFHNSLLSYSDAYIRKELSGPYERIAIENQAAS